MAGAVDEGEEGGGAGQKRSWWRSWLGLLLTLGLSALAAYLGLRRPNQVAVGLFAWQWAAMGAAAWPVWALPLALMFCIVVLLEAHSARLLGSTANRQGGAGGTTASSSSRAGASVYVLIGVREPAVWFGRSLAGELVFYALIHAAAPTDSCQRTRLVLRVWTCVTLYCGANLLKALAARTLARHFHSATYFARMAAAVTKEYYLVSLCRDLKHGPGSTAVQPRGGAGVGVTSQPHSVQGLGSGGYGSASNALEKQPLLSQQQGPTSHSPYHAHTPGPTAVTAVQGLPRRAPVTAVTTAAGGTHHLHAQGGAPREGSFTEGEGDDSIWSRLRASWRQASDLQRAAVTTPDLATLVAASSGELAAVTAEEGGQGMGAHAFVRAASMARHHSSALAWDGAAGCDSPTAAGRDLQLSRLSQPPSQPRGEVQLAEAGRAMAGAAAVTGGVTAGASTTKRPTKSTGAGFFPSLYWLERHIRGNKLRLSLTEQLGQAAEGDSDEAGGAEAAAARTARALFAHILQASAEARAEAEAEAAAASAAAATAAAKMKTGGMQGSASSSSLRGGGSGGGGGAGSAGGSPATAGPAPSSPFLTPGLSAPPPSAGAGGGPPSSIGIASGGGVGSSEQTRPGTGPSVAPGGGAGGDPFQGQAPFLTQADLQPFFEQPHEAAEAFAILDLDGDGRVTLEALTLAITNIYKERRKLALTLKDTKSVVGKLEMICGVVLHTICALIYLSIFKVNVRELWLTISSVAFAFVFVFGNSIRSIYEAAVFLFVVHPFDVGDLLQLASGDVVKVEEIALMSVTLQRIPDGRRLYYPLPRLAGEPFANFSRSEAFTDAITILLDASIPARVLDSLQSALKAVVGAHPREYTGATSVTARGVEAYNKLRVVLQWEYSHTGEEVPRTNAWRSRVLLEVAAALAKEGISYTLPPQPQVMLPASCLGGALGLQMGSGMSALEAAQSLKL